MSLNGSPDLVKKTWGNDLSFLLECNLPETQLKLIDDLIKQIKSYKGPTNFEVLNGIVELSWSCKVYILVFSDFISTSVFSDSEDKFALPKTNIYYCDNSTEMNAFFEFVKSDLLALVSK